MLQFEYDYWNRKHNECLDKSSFKEEDRTVFEYMLVKSGKQLHRVMAFVFLHGLEEEYAYINFYIWDMRNGESVKRFIISKHYHMPYEEENEFDKYCHTSIFFDDENSGIKISRTAKQIFLSLNLPVYDDTLMLLNHIYYGYHPGMRELFYKSEICFIAYKLDEIEEINIVGTCPASILELPIKMIRLLNNPEGICLIKTKENRKLLKRLFEFYGDFFIRNGMNQYQFRYLKENDWVSIKKLNTKNRQIYKTLRYITCEKNYIYYMLYIEKIESFSDYYTMPLFMNELKDEALKKDEVFERYFEQADFLFGCIIEKRKQINRELIERARKLERIYAYEDDYFKTVICESVKDICSASRIFKNCLWSYILEEAYGNKTIILVFYKKENLPYMAIEIEDGKKVLCALKCCNASLNNEDVKWLKKYVKEKDLEMQIGQVEHRGHYD